MKDTKTYVAQPVEVEVAVIIAVRACGAEGGILLEIRHPDGGPLRDFNPDSVMLSRMKPYPGDYVVTQSDGYVYLNPKDVFERKYRAKPEPLPGVAERPI